MFLFVLYFLLLKTTHKRNLMSIITWKIVFHFNYAQLETPT